MRRVIFGVGAALLLIVAAAVILIGNAAMDARRAAVTAAMPPGWMDLVRLRTVLPAAAAALGLPRDTAGDGAVALYDTTRGVWGRLRLDAALAAIRAGSAPEIGDAVASEVEHDAVLDRWVLHARRDRWVGEPRFFARLGPAGPDHGSLQRRYDRFATAAQTLALRGWIRTARRDLAGARRDLAAAMGLGLRLVHDEPTLDGFLTGRTIVHLAALGLRNLGEQASDTMLVRQATMAADWSSPSTASSYAILSAAPESSLVMARDTARSLGWRAAALAGYVAAPLQRPSGLLLGIPHTVEADLATLAAGATRPQDRRLMAAAHALAEWIDALGPFGRLSRLRGARLLRELEPTTNAR